WTNELVDNLNVVAYIYLAFDSASHPAISYYDAYPADLKYATKASGSWQTQTLAKKGAQGLFTNLWFDDAGDANILYYSRKSNSLVRLRGSLSSWSSDIVSLSGASQ